MEEVLYIVMLRVVKKTIVGVREMVIYGVVKIELIAVVL